MELIVALTAAIRFRMGYVKNFTTRVDTLTKERIVLAQKLERVQKSLKDLRNRKKAIYPFLKKLRQGSEEHAQSLGGLNEIKARIEDKKSEEAACFEAVDLNARLLGFAKKSLATSELKLADAEAELVEHNAKIKAEQKAIEDARIKAEAEVEAKRVADEKAARKAEKHAKNREMHRQKKEARRLKRLEARQQAATMVGRDDTAEFLSDRIDATRKDDFVIPAKALVLASELGADVTNPAEREIVLSLFTETQASA